ncbi:MAG: hypothetical protein ACOYBO_07715 [Azonexus sp.]
MAALVATPTAEGAAAAAGVARSTLYAWLEQPAFVAAVTAAHAGVLEDAQRRLGAALKLATAAILRILEDENQPAHVQLRAAELVIDSLLKLKQAGEFERRLTELETKANEHE